jgi:hypothetical protein
LFLVLSTSLFIANLAFQSLQNYFCKLLEKDKYTALTKKSLNNFMANILLGTILVPLTFALYSQTIQAGFIALFVQFYAALIIGVLIREDNKNTVISNLFGLIVAGILSLILVLIAAKQSLGLGVTVGIISIVLAGVCSSIAEFIGNLLQNLISPKAE